MQFQTCKELLQQFLFRYHACRLLNTWYSSSTFGDTCLMQHDKVLEVINNWNVIYVFISRNITVELNISLFSKVILLLWQSSVISQTKWHHQERTFCEKYGSNIYLADITYMS